MGYSDSMYYRHWPLIAKLMLIAAVGLLLAGAITWLGLGALSRSVALAEGRIRDGLMAARTAELRHDCELAVDLLRSQSAGLDQSARKERLRALLGEVYFMTGSDGSKAGYFFAYDRQGVTLLLPPNRALHDVSRWDLQASGVYVVRGLVEAGVKGGSTFTYLYPKPGGPKGPDGKPVPQPKLSYSMPSPGRKMVRVSILAGTSALAPTSTTLRPKRRRCRRRCEPSMHLKCAEPGRSPSSSWLVRCWSPW